MKTIAEVMTSDPMVLQPQDSVQQAAQRMRDWNVGALPVCDGKRLQGMITDRDVTVRVTAEGRSPDECKVSEVMTPEVAWCFADQSIGEVLQEMGDRQVRRLPVLGRNMELQGMVSLGDLATHDANVNEALGDISTPSEPARKSREEAQRPH